MRQGSFLDSIIRVEKFNLELYVKKDTKKSFNGLKSNFRICNLDRYIIYVIP